MASAAHVTKQLKQWLDGASVPIWDLFIHLPDGLDLALLERVLKKYLRDGHSIGVAGRRLNPAYLELFLRCVARLPPTPERFAALATPSTGEAPARAKALAALLDKTRKLSIFSMSRSQASARAREFAKDAAFVGAAQVIVQRAKFPDGKAFWRWSFVETLLNDASEASLDALLPLVSTAVKKRASSDRETLRAVVHRLKNPKPGLQPLIELLK